MIITKTPFRMSFFGGGTDMPEFFNEYGGSVISTTIDKYCYVNVRHLPPFFEYYSEIVYARIERVKETEEIKHPLVRNAMDYLDIHDVRVNYEADLPARSGLGTSSSFAVGMLEAFYTLKGKTVSKEKLAKDAIYLERVLCNEAGGWQDQIAAAYGGFNRIDFKGDDFTVTPIGFSDERKDELNKNLRLYFTGFTRLSSDIQKDSKKLEDKLSQLKEMQSLVDEAEQILTGDKALEEYGRLLHHTWQLKRKTGNHVSTDAIDDYYQKAIDAGATGGKLLGAGGGGFLLFYVPEDAQSKVDAALEDLLHIPFEFENEGSSIVYESPETYSFRGENK